MGVLPPVKPRKKSGLGSCTHRNLREGLHKNVCVVVCGCRHRRSPFARRRGGGAEPHDTAVGQADDGAYKAHAQTDTVANGAQGRAHCEAQL